MTALEPPELGGGGDAISNVRVAEPTLPNPSVARTTIVCEPGARPLNSAGLVQAANAAAVQLALDGRRRCPS